MNRRKQPSSHTTSHTQSHAQAHLQTAKPAVAIVWLRRDLRFRDNTALNAALSQQSAVLPIFIFDPHILKTLPQNDARVRFIHQRLQQMHAYLAKHHGSGIARYHGDPLSIFQQLRQQMTITAVYANRDYEPYARQRDNRIAAYLDKHHIAFHTFKDHVIFEPHEVVKTDQSPYTVYTPYMKCWRQQLAQQWATSAYNADTDMNNHIPTTNWATLADYPSVSLASMGFTAMTNTPNADNTAQNICAEGTHIESIRTYDISDDVLMHYGETRDFPAQDATSHLGPHLRFGTISIRQVMKKAQQYHADIFQNELIWREFFMQILWHFPHTTTQCFHAKYEAVAWRHNEQDFARWCQGTTGYPLVDAGMRELNATGYMHNRVRMVVASFLCKHLLIDWRWGEAYFAEKLHDYEQASNVGNWQWAAGCGVDAAPYFRIFNPHLQAQKFDANLCYISRWVPEYNTANYSSPIIDHKAARARCLATYQQALK
ncbi:deoxyribodipyrimidine photo-lyase [Cardiobacteriales bacterium ML27]|uniref:Deoxyribodipyrimidine photo-lyase n=2 Tax=Ostreibacterium oceani TaxID=2654998 RepID=A0A6N7EU26_9GAMM|nr:deoxyribodipyrimidine photo-lyase [Ostreibacterium oceani]